VDPVSDLLLRKSGSTGNRTQTSGYVAKNSDRYTTEAVMFRNRMLFFLLNFSSFEVALSSYRDIGRLVIFNRLSVRHDLVGYT
jgi:hypothetical protein